MYMGQGLCGPAEHRGRRVMKLVMPKFILGGEQDAEENQGVS